MLRLALIRISIDRKKHDLTAAQVTKAYRKLYGYHSHSYYGKYHNWVTGFVDEINGKRVASNAIMIPAENIEEFTDYSKEKSIDYEIVTDEIFMKGDVFEEVIPFGKKTDSPN